MLVIRPAQLSILELAHRRTLAHAVVADVRVTAPHAVAGLAPAELAWRLDLAIDKTARHRLDTPADIQAFVRLAFVVGPGFDDYPPFRRILLDYDGATRVPALFVLAADDDWRRAAHFDIVARYRKAPRMVESIALAPLTPGHADVYFRHALHPDVWRLGGIQPLPDADATGAMIGGLGAAGKSGYVVVDAQARFLGAVFGTRVPGATRVSYWIVRDQWGRGIASQALTLLRARLQPGEAVLHIEPGNTPSMQVAAKCGFRQTDATTYIG